MKIKVGRANLVNTNTTQDINAVKNFVQNPKINGTKYANSIYKRTLLQI
jgi:hypothetical protein